MQTVRKMLKREELCYTSRLKFYPGEPDPVELLVTEEHIFNPDQVELASTWKEFSPSMPKAEKEKTAEDGTSEGALQARDRATKRAYDYVRCNPQLNVFVTLTLDEDKVSRDEWGEIIQRLNRWLDNRVRRNGLCYLLCPEYHKDGKSIHFHGLMNENALRMVRAVNARTGKPLFRKGKAVYNIEDFPYGFTAVIRITGEDATRRIAGYIFKYMKKQLCKIGGRYFLAGGDLVKPVYVYGNIDFNDVDAPAFALKGASGGCKCLKGEELKAFLEASESLQAGAQIFPNAQSTVLGKVTQTANA